MKKLFSIDVKIYATAYIVAESAEEAQKIADGLADEALEFSSRQQNVGVDSEIIITGESYHADMPELTLSPAMTVYGPDEGQTVDLVEEFDEEEEAADA